MDPEFIRRLQALRAEWGKPIRPVDGGGFRCLIYEPKGGAHTEGRAIDPGIAQADIFAFIEHAIYYGFTGIGIKNKGGRWQLHVDDAETTQTRPRPWIWTYQ